MSRPFSAMTMTRDERRSSASITRRSSALGLFEHGVKRDDDRDRQPVGQRDQELAAGPP
jgi:hypothetical protein